ncbi:MAG: hypothetical protein R2799_01225 [Crocinitomicaceae bacterium]
MDKKARNFKDVIINYITFETGDNEALIDCKIEENKKARDSKLIISMSDLNKLIFALKRVLTAELSIECHTIDKQSSFYQIDLTKSGIQKLDLSSFFKSNSIRQIIA